jgi:hypothetical protein
LIDMDHADLTNLRAVAYIVLSALAFR